jgi:hypothetical protein
MVEIKFFLKILQVVVFFFLGSHYVIHGLLDLQKIVLKVAT